MTPDHHPLRADGNVAALEPQPRARRNAQRLGMFDLHALLGNVPHQNADGAEAAGDRLGNGKAFARAKLSHFNIQFG